MELPKTYTLKIAGLERELPVLKVAPGIFLASFVMLGDTELIEASADALYKHSDFPRDDIEIIVCPEAKAIPLAHALAVRLGVDYVVLRKSEKPYMRDQLVVTTRSITTDSEQKLVLDGRDRKRLEGKKICIVDDVVATGGSLKSIEELLAKANCTIIAQAAALLEDGGYQGEKLIYLERHPIFRETEH